jgi:hypothetical protein
MPAVTPATLRRWLVVGVLVSVVCALPWAVGAIPAASAKLSAQQLVQRIEGSASVAYTGYAESAGGLVLPITDSFSEIANLFGDRTKMRAWYHSPTASRVDAITYTGETDVYTDPRGTWTWDFEAEEATRSLSTTAAAAIPTPADLLPPAVARRVLSHAAPQDLSTIPAQRIAGRSAAGVRLTPSDPAATVARIDVWADEATGVALRVVIYGADANSALDTSFLDVDFAAPEPGLLVFVPPTGATVRIDNGDLIGRLQQRGGIGAISLPATLAGFARTGDGGVDSVGIYGDTITSFVAIYLPERVSRSLRSTLRDATTTAVQDVGLSTTSGPISLLLADTGGRSRWLLVGTVTVPTLVAASTTLLPLGSGA